MWFLYNQCRVCDNKKVRDSDYCTSHICREWNRNRSCLKRGKGPNNLCSDHGQCVKQYGGRKCGRPRKKLDPDYRYCADIHACQDDDCRAPNLGCRSATVISKWCVNHACANTECAEPRVGGGQGCLDHTCHATGCVIVVPGTADTDKSHIENYCHGHRTCRKDGCENPIFIHMSNRNSTFCFEHFCKLGGGACDKERVDGGATSKAEAEACEDHTCALYHLNKACFKPKTSLGGLYCAVHECTRAGCQRERHVGKEWCSEHLCSSPLELREDCANEREGAAANQIYCKDHKLCDEPGCREFRMFRGNVRQEKCEEHSKPKCKFPGCANTAPDAAADHCASHLCQYAQGCRQPPIPGTPIPICWIHKCADSLCLQPRIAPPLSFLGGPSSTSTSAGPAAASSNPAYLVMAMMQLGGKVGSYCHGHTCRARDCLNKVYSPPTPFPSSSRNPSWYANAGWGGGGRSSVPEYCDEHKCRERECLAAGEREHNGYCRDHEGGGGGGGWGQGWGSQLGSGGGGGGRKNYYKAIRW